MEKMFDIDEFEKVDSFSAFVTKFSYADITSVETDSRKDLTNSLFVPIIGERFDAHDFIPTAIENGATAICSSRGLSQETIKLAESHKTTIFMVRDTLTFYQQLSSYHRDKFSDLKVVAITGSCGKTSTKEIVASLISENPESVLKTTGNTNNHIGVPQNLLRLRAHHKFAVLELGTNHFGEIKLLTDLVKPDAAMITCIGGAHLEFLIDRDGVAREKSDIFTSMKTGATAVVPIDELQRDSIKFKTESLKQSTFGALGSSANWQADELISDLSGSTISLKGPANELTLRWSLTGTHQATNAAGALALVNGLGITLTNSEIETRLKRVKLPGMRGKISEVDGVTWINDAYNANAESTISTLKWLESIRSQVSGKIHVVLGDMLELGKTSPEEHFMVLQFLAENQFFDKLFLVGKEYGESFKKFSTLSGFTVCFLDSAKAKEAVAQQLEEGDAVFLKGSRGIKLELIVP